MHFQQRYSHPNFKKNNNCHDGHDSVHLVKHECIINLSDVCRLIQTAVTAKHPPLYQTLLDFVVYQLVWQKLYPGTQKSSPAGLSKSSPGRPLMMMHKNLTMCECENWCLAFSLFDENVVFLAEAEYSYFCAEVGLKYCSEYFFRLFTFLVHLVL